MGAGLSGTGFAYLMTSYYTPEDLPMVKDDGTSFYSIASYVYTKFFSGDIYGAF